MTEELQRSPSLGVNVLSFPGACVSAADRVYNYMDGPQGPDDHNANRDFSAAPVEWTYQAPPDKMAIIGEFIVSIEDNQNFTAGGYGAIAGGLTNGVKIFYRDAEGNAIPDPSGITGIKTNAEWARVSHKARPDDWGSGINYLNVYWAPIEQLNPICLRPNEKMCVQLNDDLSTLIGHYFIVTGKLQWV